MAEESIKSIKGIGPKTAEHMAVLGLNTLDDLIHYYPTSYRTYPDIIELADAPQDTKSAFYVEITKPLTNIRASRYKITSTTVCDDSDSIRCMWFNSTFLSKTIHSGNKYVLYGVIKTGKQGKVLEHPMIYKYDDYIKLIHSLTPVYRLTKGLSLSVLSKGIESALLKTDHIAEYLPKEIIHKYKLADEDTSIRIIHNPDTQDDMIVSRHRLIFDEFFKFIYNIKLAKQNSSGLKSEYRVLDDIDLEPFFKLLPYSLTESQHAVIKDIYKDMSSGKVMNRLIQGDVGSGKTVIAVCAMYMTYMSGYQSAIMVPTEVLARQHYNTITSLFANSDKKPGIVLLTGSLTPTQKRAVQEDIQMHKADIIIGTHALIQEHVNYDSLSLVVTDEQHRFGVQQREALTKKGSDPHILVMSATPIPRTLAVIMYGDLDISIVDSKPVGRLPIKNVVITKKDRAKAYHHIAEEVKKGHQAIVICPLVDESEAIEAENVVDYAKSLQTYYNNEIKVDFLHGRMQQKEKDVIMKKFMDDEIDVLVSTTVIEVGVDVPNATVMMIEDAQRFGLASLHQLRGRVGRGKDQAYCIFVMTSETEQAKARLSIVGNSNDGFYIAEEDLKLRGPGELLGVEQSGDMSFGIGDIYSDADVLKEASEAASTVDTCAGISDSFYQTMSDYRDKKMNNINL